MKKLISQRLPILLTLSLAVAAVFGLSSPVSAMADCTPGAADKPDLGFVDSNCDGIDGDKAAAIFVAPGGSDANDGSFGHPMATVTAAVVAGLAAHKDVYVAAGTYDGKVSILGSIGGIGIYGGYDPSTWARSAANVTTLQAPHQVVTVAVPGIVLQMLTIKGTYEGSTSYGVRAWNHGEFALSRVAVEPAPGGNGSDGASASQSPPAAAPNGKQGVGNPNCDPNALKGTFNPGAKGGEAAGLLSAAPAATGSNRIPSAERTGRATRKTRASAAGSAAKCTGRAGSVRRASRARRGSPVSTSSTRAALIYAPQRGTDGGSGTRGAGGGGGGMGADTCIPGSGGGAGGRPGTGGKGGSGGGGSIGVFVGEGASALILDDSTIHAADGGKGGNGGLGQPGGAGGEGGEPGIDIYDNGEWPGTSGGQGGKGGNGGQGGGGAGGASVGVLAIDARAVVNPETTITVGKGGYGGQGGHIGWQGASKPIAQETTAGGSIPAVGDFHGDGLNDEADACPIAAGGGNGCPATAAGPQAASGGHTLPLASRR